MEISEVISGVFTAIYLIILADIISGFLGVIGVNTDTAFFSFVNDIGEVFLSPGRMIFDALGIQTGMLDFSPMVSLLILQALEGLLLSVFR